MKITLKRAISPITSFCPRAKKDFSTNSIHYNKIKLPSSDKKQSLAVVWDFFVGAGAAAASVPCVFPRALEWGGWESTGCCPLPLGTSFPLPRAPGREQHPTATPLPPSCHARRPSQIFLGL